MIVICAQNICGAASKEGPRSNSHELIRITKDWPPQHKYQYKAAIKNHYELT